VDGKLYDAWKAMPGIDDKIKTFTGRDANAFWDKEGWTDTQAGSVNSFADCVKESEKLTDDLKDENVKAMVAFAAGEGFNFLEALETKYDCTLFCKAGPFYLTRDLSDMMPEQGCFNAIFDDLQSKGKNVGAVMFVAGGIVLLGFVFAFPLCSGFSKKE